MGENEGFNELRLSEENQQFNTFDVLSIFLCFVMVLSIGGALFNSHLNQKKSALAHHYVENLAQDLIMKPVIYSQDSDSRVPASETNVELDPWGVAYKYSVIKNSYGLPIYVVVLSGGPDRTFETDVAENMPFSQTQIESVQFKGDDIGYIKSFR
jgi:hypothetical protein